MQVAPFATAKARIHWLVAMASVVIILTAALYAAETIREGVAEVDAISHPGEMESLAYSTAEAARVTFTNLSSGTIYQCVRGVVASKDGRKSEKSVAVCTGDVKPHTTVTVDAPYHAGSVRALCSGEPNRFGNREMDWDLCTFDLEAVKAAR